MTKYTVMPGFEIDFDSHSLSIRPLDDGPERDPEVFLYRSDGTEASPDLRVRHVHVAHSGRGGVILKNSSANAVEVEVPALLIGAPATTEDA